MNFFKELSALLEAGIVRSQKAGTVHKSVNALDLAWGCVLLMIGIGVVCGSIKAEELADHPVWRLLKVKAKELS